MRQTLKQVVLRSAVVALALWAAPAVFADEGVIGGVDLGAAVPIGPFRKVENANVGGVFSPFAGYMFNDYMGAMVQLQAMGMPLGDHPDGSSRDSSEVWALGATAGPRIALPLDRVELYATGQAGVFTGLANDTPISRTSWGFSTGGGVNVRVTDQFLVGVFGRYNWLDQRADDDTVRYATAGVSFTYNAARPSAPAPRVAQAPPPPPPPQPTPPAKKKIVLRGVNFDFDKSNIRADAKPVLDEAIATLKQEGGVAVIAEGHTDSKGTDAYNQKLSERRANAVRDYLVKGGIAPDRITSEGFGESRPVASNETDDGRAQNRRVELRIR